MKSILYILLGFAFLSMLSVDAQERRLAKAEKAYDRLAYIDAITVYLKVAEAGYKSEELFQNLADSYYFNANYEEASKWYSALYELQPDQDAIYDLRYSQSLKNIGNDSQSAVLYKQFLSKNPVKDTQLSVADYKERIAKNSGRYTIKPTDINTDGVDFGTAYLNKNHIAFASTRDTGTVIKRRHKWNNLPFMDIYTATMETNGQLVDVEKLPGKVNGRFHETTPVFSKDGTTMYFTRNNIKKNGDVDIRHVKIYRARKIDGKWIQIENLSINSDNYSTSHPALSPDEKTLYFSSDMPGGQGASDLYLVPINDDNSLGALRNMGDLINTRGRESFPYITKDNKLYFSSDGHYGLGGYDVFYMNLNDPEEGIINVGEPINSNYDDICYVIDEATKRGYLSSNRDGGQGNDDIYSFIETEPIKTFRCLVKGTIRDIDTKEVLPFSKVSVTTLDGEPIAQTTADSNGYYEATIECDTNILIRAEKQDYATEEVTVLTDREITNKDIELKKVRTKPNIGDDISKILSIENIYFDFDKWNIRADAQVELQKLVEFMNTYQNIKIDIRSHTDSRANDNYNIILSNRRAQSTMQYIIKQGIDPSRLSAKGYGETELTNGCKNNVPCSKEEHQANRRSAFVIIDK